jgi:hypothetical protein
MAMGRTPNALHERPLVRRTASTTWRSIQTRMGGTVFGRFFWALMLAIHVPACIRTWQAVAQPASNEAQFGAAVWLIGAVVFFVLKLLGVSWLRFQTDRRSLCAISLAVLLIHAGPIGFRLPDAMVPGNTPLLGTMLLMAGLGCVQQIFQGPSNRNSGRSAVLPCYVHLLAPATKCIHCSIPLIRRAPRPPPARA